MKLYIYLFIFLLEISLFYSSSNSFPMFYLSNLFNYYQIFLILLFPMPLLSLFYINIFISTYFYNFSYYILRPLFSSYYIFIQKIIHQQMEKQQIHNQLKEINLNLDPQTITQIESYFVKEIGFINQIQLQFQIFGVVAIVSQIRTLPTIGKQGQSKNGINIEKVMSHLGKLSKQRFLNTLTRQLQKLKKPPQHLKKKIQDIRYSYRFYKKYQCTFQALYQKMVKNRQCKQQFSALFWVVFLYIKNTHIQTQNITQSKCFLILLFRMIFEKFLSISQFDQIFHIMEQKIGSIPPIQIDRYQHYSKIVEDKLNSFYSHRFFQNTVNFSKLLENFTFVERLLDDMSNAYVKEQTSLRYYNEIDELSYLQLKKNLTPQVFRKTQIIENPQVITKQLFFDESDQEQDRIQEQLEDIIKTPSKMPIIEGTDGLPTPKLVYSFSAQSPSSTPTWKTLPSPKILSSQLLQDDGGSTPISKKIQNEAWMYKRINSTTADKIKQFLCTFEVPQTHPDQIIEESLNFETFYATLKSSIYQLIKDFTPKCRDYQERFTKILAFIVSNYSQLQTQKQVKFSQIDSFQLRKQKVIGLASLSCQIFNYVNNSVSYEFKHQCGVFKTDKKMAYQTLELFKGSLSQMMPIDLKEYLKKTSKRFFIDDIWQNCDGYKILCETNKESQFKQIRQKIFSQSEMRVRQICRQAGIQAKIVNKTQNMIKFIFQKKPYLLRNNNIDQIILCCLMSCLSINEKQEHQTLELLFCEYNSNIQFSFNSNQLGLKDQYGNEMKIVEYYNEVFLGEIQDMLNQKQDQLNDFLLTPVRITKQYSSLSSIKKDLDKKKQLPGSFLFNPQKARQRKINYRQNLIKQNLQMRQEKQQEQEDVPSPSFRMYKTFSFQPQLKK